LLVTLSVDFRTVAPSTCIALKKEALLETLRDDFRTVGPST